MKRLLLITMTILSILLVANIVFTEEDKDANIITSVIDGFEEENAWNIHFSRFRSHSWKQGDNSRMPSNKWIKWIKADDNQIDYMGKHILSASVGRKQELTGEKTILAVRANWDQKGQNWLNLEPSNRRLAKQNIGNELLGHQLKLKNELDPETYILLSGKTKKILCYFWGMGYNYKAEVHIMDYKGNTFIISGGHLNFAGWKNLEFKIPRFIKQFSPYLPITRPLKLVRIKILAAPGSENQGFFTYLDYLHAKTDIYAKYFRGKYLERNHIYWNKKQSSNKTNKK